MAESPREREIRMENESLFEVWRTLIPDGRTRARTGQIPSPLGLITPLFCASCGKGLGGVYGEVPHAVVVCDPCHATHGGLPELQAVHFEPDVSAEALAPQRR